MVLIFSIVWGTCLLQEPQETPKDLARDLFELVQQAHKEGQFNGAVLVARDGQVILDRCVGYSRIDGKIPLTHESVFEIASLSKQFTAMLIMIQMEEGDLDVDDPVRDYLPPFPYDSITIRHLLTHTSGLSEKVFFAWAGANMEQGKYYTNHFVLDYLVQERPKLAFDPGTRWEYSNVGYFMLALILEELTGRKYAEELTSRILEPLEMNHSGILPQDVKKTLETYADGHLHDPQSGERRSSFGMAWSDEMYGGVGILSNTADLLKWDKALTAGSLVSADTLEEAFTAFTLEDGSTSNYGFGWFVRDEFEVAGKSRGKRLDHHGLWPGYEASIVRFLEDRFTIVLLCNQAPSAKDELVERLTNRIFEDDEKSP